MIDAHSFTCAGMVLAGGRGTRMGAGPSKPLRLLGGVPLIQHVLVRLEEFCRPVLINARNRKPYEALGYRVVHDLREGYPGPLAGIEAGLHELSQRSERTTHLLVLPADTPFLPRSLLAPFHAHETVPSIAALGERLQPTVGLWPLSILPTLSQWLDDGRSLAIRAFLDHTDLVVVPFQPSVDAPNGDPFFNVNTQADLAEAETQIVLNCGRQVSTEDLPLQKRKEKCQHRLDKRHVDK